MGNYKSFFGRDNNGSREKVYVVGNLNRVWELTDAVINFDVNVLITGETGTGKELIAKSLHFRGRRRDKPFVAVNCGAIPEGLLEAEMFGHVKGAYTGATKNRKGYVKKAEHGTLFLDEIGDMPLNLQIKLLRFLEDRTYCPVGSSEPLPANVRVLAATNQDLEVLTDEGKFRRDLLHRLNVFSIILPPLRERIDDLEVLTSYLVAKQYNQQHQRKDNVAVYVGERKSFQYEIGKSSGARTIILDPRIIRKFGNYAWPGNVRQLESMLSRAVILASSQCTKDSEDIKINQTHTRLEEDPLIVERKFTFPVYLPDLIGSSIDEAIDAYEKDMIERALKATDGVQARAAQMLGINERAMWHRVKKLSIKIADFKPSLA